ncbi:hypothetical protein QBC38DRAFT_544066 [Podospora fimiseda]|uniref:Uncharacterized protein n=1 Tax=Podospora fimiseda TaxID=252190 RepID=A0AAN7H1I4_9PEZI|nr:hypothetical protein QBC38DRAFT_544066 [Podospora fimiseda]
MVRHQDSKPIKQAGFYFPPGPAFVDDVAASRIYPAITGSTSSVVSSESTLKLRAFQSLTGIFTACKKFSEIVAQEAVLYTDLDAMDVKEVAKVMAQARRNYHGHLPPSSLNALVDDFINLQIQTQQLGPVNAVGLPGHSRTDPAVDSLANLPRHTELGTRLTWPPIYFTGRDFFTLLDAHVHDWAMSLSPVGFSDSKHRQSWYGVLGRQSKVFGTLQCFLQDAMGALTTRNKKVYMGLLIFWLLQPDQLERIADATQTDPLDIWTGNRALRGYGMVMILRRAHGKLQITWYDPWRLMEAVRNLYKPSITQMYRYREHVVEKIKAWASNNNIPLYNQYWGGHGVETGGDDSVLMSIKYLEHLVSAPGGVESVLPDPQNREEFEAAGFYLAGGDNE